MGTDIRVGDKRFRPYRDRVLLRGDVAVLAERLARDLEHVVDPLALCILNGSFIFAADLLRMLPLEIAVTFVRYASYRGMSSTGQPRELLGLNERIEGRDIVIVEDIVDTGSTMAALLEHVRSLGAASIRVVTMFVKPEAFQGDFKIDYVGCELPNRFVVGYGLDYDGRGRNLPDLYIVDE